MFQTDHIHTRHTKKFKNKPIHRKYSHWNIHKFVHSNVIYDSQNAIQPKCLSTDNKI